MDDLDDLLPRRQALRHLRAKGALLHRRDELLDDIEVDVGLEQCEADLADRRVDIVLAQTPARAQVAENAAESVGERVKHWSDNTGLRAHVRRIRWKNGI